MVINQKTSPSDADCAGPLDSGGTLPLPAARLPWQELHFVAYSLYPAATAVRCCPYGFFSRTLDEGALWKLLTCAVSRETEKIHGIAQNAAVTR